MINIGNKLKMVLGTMLMMFGVIGLAMPVMADTSATSDKINCTDPAGCAGGGLDEARPEGDDTQLMTTITKIINVVIFVIGIIAVVMVILGGIRYSTSQGDATKVKSAKDTIMYGIIGLVIAILAFAIVNFVLTNVFQN